MRRLFLIISVSAICFLGRGSFVVTANAQETTSPNYVVQYGDTLWDIATDQLNNPYRWREIHQNNPHIVNPHLIYPGDTLGIASQRPGIAEGQKEAIRGKRRSDKAIARPWYGLPAPQAEEVEQPPIPNPIVPSSDFIESNGYIIPYTIKQLQAEQFAQISGAQIREGEANSQVIHSENGQPGLVFGDNIYINKGADDGIRLGEMLLAFRPIREIQHPLTSEIVGTQVAILGRMRVKAVESKVSCAEIIKSYNYIEVGNPIMPVSELSIPLEKPLTANARSFGVKVGNELIGHIIAEKIGRLGISYGDIIFLDVGAAQGVQPADNFVVYREIGDGYPKQAIGSATVLSVREQTSTAIVTRSVKTIEIGENVVLKR